VRAFAAISYRFLRCGRIWSNKAASALYSLGS